MKYFLVLVSLLACTAYALAPEYVMYRLYAHVHPVTMAEKLFTVFVFWFIGGGLCVFTALTGFAGFMAALAASLE